VHVTKDAIENGCSEPAKPLREPLRNQSETAASASTGQAAGSVNGFATRTRPLQRAEHEFDPIPFDSEAARAYGRVVAAVGRKPRRRATDLMIAATAIAAGMPWYTTNPGDFSGLDRLLAIVPVTRPTVPTERWPSLSDG
jgi:predicted nucleic acid-binding protein